MKGLKKAIREAEEKLEQAQSRCKEAEKEVGILADALAQLKSAEFIFSGAYRNGNHQPAKTVSTPISSSRRPMKWRDVYRNLLNGSREFTLHELVHAAQLKQGPTATYDQAYASYWKLKAEGAIKVIASGKVTWNE
jgi:hypothetical protein